MRFILRRFGFFLVTLWAALTVNFAIPRLMPGSPAEAMMSRFRGPITPGALKAIQLELGSGSHQNIVIQYVKYLGNCFTGNFGTSAYFYPESVAHVIGQAIPYTLGLVGVTTIIAFILGTVIGIVSAWRRGGWLDGLLPPIFVILSAFPFFWIGLMAILIFSNSLHWLPSAFGYDNSITPGLSVAFIESILLHAILPGATIVVTSIGGWILTMRNNMITTLSEDYVRMARAKGIRPVRIMFDYAGRNAVLPNLTGFAMSLGFVVSGAVLVEYVFNYQGVGFLLLQAVDNEDYALMQALFLLITVAVLLAVLLADIVTAILDPRTRSGS